MTNTRAITEPWYAIQNANEVDSPALLVCPERVKANIAAAKAMVGDVRRLRPHVKTHKSAEITRLQLAEGITHFKCATLAEAEMLARCEAPDVLLAFPLVGPRLDGFLQMRTRYPASRFSTIVDNADAAKTLSDAALAMGTVADVYIDLDIGMGRTGVPAGPPAAQLYAYCKSLSGINLCGLHAYDGHVREPDADLLRQQCEKNYSAVTNLVTDLVNNGFAMPEIIIGGSPSFPFYARLPEVQCSPGTFVLWDHGYATDCPDQPFQIAALLLCRVISLPSENTVCLDLGHKAVGAENPIDKRIHFLNAPSLKALRQSEEHLVLQADSGHTFKVGDVLYGVPIHVCPTVNLYDAFNVLERGRVVTNWNVDARHRFRKAPDK